MRHFRMDSGLLSGFLYISLLLLLSSYLVVNLDQKKDKTLQLQAEKGKFSLTFWYPQTSPPQPLSGEWFSFPDQLLSPEAAAENMALSSPVIVPDVWHSNGPRRHAVTYVLSLSDIPQQIELGLLIPEIKNSFRLFLDDREVASGGVSSVHPDQIEGYFGDKVVYLGMLRPDAQLTLQVSNYRHARGGIHEAMILAPYEHWQAYYRNNILLEGVVICLALLAGILILVEFAHGPKHKELLWIALFTLLLAGYTGTTGLGTFLTLFGAFPWEIAVRLEYIGFSCAIPLFIKWLGSLYGPEATPRLVQYLPWLSLFLLLLIILTPSVLFTELLYALLVYMSICILLTVMIVVRLFLLNRAGIRILAFGGFALFASILHDLGVFFFGEGFLAGEGSGSSLMPLGVLLFLISQVGFLAFFRTHEQLWIIQLNHHLQDDTATLENQLNERKQELQLRSRELEQRRRDLQQLKNEDELTGLSNRHTFVQQIMERIKRNQRSNFAVLMIDIDYFKQINDEYGREFAESVLRRVSQRLIKECKGHFDWVPARYGGDEFVLWLGGSDFKQASRVAERIQQDIARMQLPIFSQPGSMFKFTVSIGIASSERDGETSLDALLARAADDVHHQRNKQRFQQGYQQARIVASTQVFPVKGFNIETCNAESSLKTTAGFNIKAAFNGKTDPSEEKGKVRGYRDD